MVADDFVNGSPSMWRVVVLVASLAFLPGQAEARHHHPRLYQHFRDAMASYGGEEAIVGGRPSGCPDAFCGCEASLFRFGRIIPQLNLAANWRRFPRAAPATGMAAGRSGHVMILQRQVEGDI